MYDFSWFDKFYNEIGIEIKNVLLYDERDMSYVSLMINSQPRYHIILYLWQIISDAVNYSMQAYASTNKGFWNINANGQAHSCQFPSIWIKILLKKMLCMDKVDGMVVHCSGTPKIQIYYIHKVKLPK